MVHGLEGAKWGKKKKPISGCKADTVRGMAARFWTLLLREVGLCPLSLSLSGLVLLCYLQDQATKGHTRTSEFSLPLPASAQPFLTQKLRCEKFESGLFFSATVIGVFLALGRRDWIKDKHGIQ